MVHFGPARVGHFRPASYGHFNPARVVYYVRRFHTTPISLMNMPIMTYIKEISPRPVLLIAGENAHSRYFSEDAYKAASEPKELMIIPGKVHTDLYDNVDVIPFDKLKSFFAAAL